MDAFHSDWYHSKVSQVERRESKVMKEKTKGVKTKGGRMGSRLDL